MGGNKTVDSLKHGVCGEIFIPGDKSISHRSVMFSSLGDKAVRIRNFLNAQDCMSTVECMRSLGIQIDQIGSTEFIVHGKGLHGLQEPQCIVDAGFRNDFALNDGNISAPAFFNNLYRRCIAS